MATFRKRGERWRAEIVRKGKRESQTFDTKAQARAWADEVEGEILSGKDGHRLTKKTLSDALAQYSRDVSPTKEGALWEQIRLDKFSRTLPFANKLIWEIAPSEIAEWRDSRSKALVKGTTRRIKGSTIIREMALLSSVFDIAVKEWGWLPENPMSQVRKPRGEPARDRRISAAEEAAMLQVLGYDPASPPESKFGRIALAFLFAIETAMRAGEICALTWQHVHVDRRFVHIAKSKNGHPRNVPLSPKAIEILGLLPRSKGDDFESSFGLQTRTLDALWRRARKRAETELPSIATLHFHDTRHEAITRLARKIDVLDLARMTGHRDLKTLRGYYNATAEDIAKLLS
ncbi:tyrosine-type recombinase/integrase [Hydrocarboniphaga effusa]|uniref:tyrosine-type recombinase/integrase n=1 Tax=Hydrocarboniphaga effusa TaxID=243629 RepID=UPI00398BF50C